MKRVSSSTTIQKNLVTYLWLPVPTGDKKVSMLLNKHVYNGSRLAYVDYDKNELIIKIPHL